MIVRKFTHNDTTLAKSFECGNLIIDNFLKSNKALDPNYGVTYILVNNTNDFIIGYYNIEVSRVDMVEQVKDTYNIIPMGGSVNINFLAIHTKFQHTKISDDYNMYIGDYLLCECEKRIARIRNDIGASFITIHSTEQGYHMYHDRNGYEDFESDMQTFHKDAKSYKLYKCIDDI